MNGCRGHFSNCAIRLSLDAVIDNAHGALLYLSPSELRVNGVTVCWHSMSLTWIELMFINRFVQLLFTISCRYQPHSGVHHRWIHRGRHDGLQGWPLPVLPSSESPRARPSSSPSRLPRLQISVYAFTATSLQVCRPASRPSRHGWSTSGGASTQRISKTWPSDHRIVV